MAAVIRFCNDCTVGDFGGDGMPKYDFFPADRYDLWKNNTVNFNPNMMFGT